MLVLGLLFPGASVVAWRYRIGLPTQEMQVQSPGSERPPGEGNWQPTPVILPEKSHGQRNLVGYSPCGRKDSD